MKSVATDLGNSWIPRLNDMAPCHSPGSHWRNHAATQISWTLKQETSPRPFHRGRVWSSPGTGTNCDSGNLPTGPTNMQPWRYPLPSPRSRTINRTVKFFGKQALKEGIQILLADLIYVQIRSPWISYLCKILLNIWSMQASSTNTVQKSVHKHPVKPSSGHGRQGTGLEKTTWKAAITKEWKGRQLLLVHRCSALIRFFWVVGLLKLVLSNVIQDTFGYNMI